MRARYTSPLGGVADQGTIKGDVHVARRITVTLWFADRRTPLRGAPRSYNTLIDTTTKTTIPTLNTDPQPRVVRV